MRDLKVDLRGNGNFKVENTVGAPSCTLKTGASKDSGSNTDWCPLMGTDASISVCTDYETSPECLQLSILLHRASLPGNSIKGTFKINVSPTQSFNVNHDVSASIMQSSLRTSGLPGISATTVTRSGPDNHGGYSWTITFMTGSNIPVEVAALEVDPTGLQTTAHDSDNEGRTPAARSLKNTAKPSQAPFASQASVLVYGLYVGKRTSTKNFCSGTGRSTCDSGSNCLSGTCVDKSQSATVVRYPDSFDCGLLQQPCYKMDASSTEQCCGSPKTTTLHNKYKDYGRCRKGNQQLSYGTCVPYHSEEYERRKIN
jgi:hypothetical protein